MISTVPGHATGRTGAECTAHHRHLVSAMLFALVTITVKATALKNQLNGYKECSMEERRVPLST